MTGETTESVRTRLIERGDQLRALERLLAEPRQARGRTAVISGPAGSGKTELLRAFSERAAADGAIVLTAVGSRAEKDLQLGVIGQLLYSADLPGGLEAQVSGLLQSGASANWPGNNSEIIDKEPLRSSMACAAFCSGWRRPGYW